MQRNAFIGGLIILFWLTACSQSEVIPTPNLSTETTRAELAETAVLPTIEPAVPESFPAQVINYNLGETTIVQEQFPEDSPFRNMPVRLEGVIGVPEHEAPHPVVLIMHGSHKICPGDGWPCSAEDEQKNYEGFTYLVEALAEAGYVALSINVNAEHTFDFGEGIPTTRTTQLIDLHLGELAAANAGETDKFGVDLNGRVDLSRIVWLGHSRGGDFANQIVREQNLAQTASPLGYGPVAGLLLVAPPIIILDTLPTEDVPFSVILPACDGDVNMLAGQGFYESARLDPGRSNFGLSVYLEGANHNHFNTILEPERVDYPADRPDCTEETAITAVAQQEFLTQYTLDFLQTIYGTPAQASIAQEQLGMAAANPVPTSFNNLAVRFNYLPALDNQLMMMQPQSDAALSQNLLGGEMTLNGVTAQFCPNGYYVPANEPGSEPCKRVNFNQPGYPQQIFVSWEASGAEWRMAVPDTQSDLTDYASIQLRTAIDPLSELNPAGEPQAFSIELVDSSGNRAAVMLSPIAFPIGEIQANDFFDGGFFSGNVHMNSHRIALTEFSDVNLENVTEIALIFDQTESGTLFVADLVLVKDGEK